LSKSRKDRRNQSRIIGGEWRSRRFQFADQSTLRPTPDRLRETLFNWLGDDIRSSRCLDLFAGSGALGLEALSRGAAFASFVDRDPVSIRHINDAISQFECHTRASAECIDAVRFLAREHECWDIIFIDPPFADGALPAILTTLAELRLVDSQGWVFIEHSSAQPAPQTGPGWVLERRSRVGASSGSLLRLDSISTAGA